MAPTSCSVPSFVFRLWSPTTIFIICGIPSTKNGILEESNVMYIAHDVASSCKSSKSSFISTKQNG